MCIYKPATTTDNSTIERVPIRGTEALLGEPMARKRNQVHSNTNRAPFNCKKPFFRCFFTPPSMRKIAEANYWRVQSFSPASRQIHSIDFLSFSISFSQFQSVPTNLISFNQFESVKSAGTYLEPEGGENNTYPSNCNKNSFYGFRCWG